MRRTPQPVAREDGEADEVDCDHCDQRLFVRRQAPSEGQHTANLHPLVARGSKAYLALEAIRTLLDLPHHPERSGKDANTRPQQLTAVETMIAQFEALRSELRRIASAGRQGIAAECRVIDTLAEHGLCAHEHAAPERTAPA